MSLDRVRATWTLPQVELDTKANDLIMCHLTKGYERKEINTDSAIRNLMGLRSRIARINNPHSRCSQSAWHNLAQVLKAIEER